MSIHWCHVRDHRRNRKEYFVRKVFCCASKIEMKSDGNSWNFRKVFFRRPKSKKINQFFDSCQRSVSRSCETRLKKFQNIFIHFSIFYFYKSNIKTEIVALMRWHNDACVRVLTVDRMHWTRNFFRRKSFSVYKHSSFFLRNNLISPFECVVPIENFTKKKEFVKASSLCFCRFNRECVKSQ